MDTRRRKKGIYGYAWRSNNSAWFAYSMSFDKNGSRTIKNRKYKKYTTFLSRSIVRLTNNKIRIKKNKKYNFIYFTIYN